ncbi:MAG: serine hydrolase [Anaerolineae bacterium]
MTALYPAAPEALGFDPARLAAVDEAMLAAAHRVFSAAALLVARRGAVVMEGAYGWLDDATHSHPARSYTLFDLASVTKLFTATAFMTLVDAGRVALDDRVSDVVPEFGGIRQIAPAENPLTGATEILGNLDWVVDAGAVTFRHLLTHTSGLPAWAPLYRLPDRDAAVAAVLGSNFAYATGDRILYSDLGLVLLTEAISRLAGEPFDAFVQRAVLKPLGLERATFNPPPDQWPDIAPTEVCRWRGRRLRGEVHDENAARLGGVSGHAGLFASVRDVATLGQMYLDGGEYAGVRVLSEDAVAEMTRVQVQWEGDRRGIGFMLQGEGGWRRAGLSDRAYGHTGFTGTSLWIDPEAETVVALLTNRVYFGRDAGGIQTLRRLVHEGVASALESHP